MCLNGYPPHGYSALVYKKHRREYLSDPQRANSFINVCAGSVVVNATRKGESVL